MSGIEIFIFSGALLLFLVCCLLAVHLHDLLYAVLASGGASVFMVVIYFMLKAPDVAITEAVVGAVLSTVLLVIAVRSTRRKENSGGSHRVVSTDE